MSDIERKYGVEESSDGDSSSGSVISAPTVAAAEEETEAEENPHSASDGAITAKHAYAVPSLLTAAPSSAAMSYPAMPITSHGIKGVPVDPGLAQSQDRLSALLDSIDSKRKREVPQAAASAAVAVESPYEWMRYKDPTTSLDYYYNIRTGVTQWERPAAFTESATSSSSSSSISTASSYGSASGYAYGLCGDAYSAQASFNKKAGSFAASGTTTYWEQVGRQNDRAGRQLGAFFDLNSFEQNRAEAALKKQKLQESHVDWKQYKEDKKKKKDAQKKEWLLKDD